MSKKKSGPALTRQQALFVERYLVSLNGADAARAAGYKTKDPRNTASLLLSKPHIRAAVDTAMTERVNRLHISQDYVLLKLVEIIEANLGDYVEFGGNRVRLKNLADIPPDKLSLLKEVAETEGGGVRVALPDKLAALDKLARHLGMYERPRQARKQPDERTRDVLAALLEKRMNPVDAALTLEAEGIPLPESLRLLLAKVEPEPPAEDDGAYSVIPPEEMAERAKRRDAEIKCQENFVRERMAGVKELKDEVGGGSFQAQNVEDGLEDGEKNS